MYQITCPQCGEIPPGRRHLFPNINSTDVGEAIHKCIENCDTKKNVRIN